MSYLYNAIQCPIVPAPTAPPSQSGCSDTTTTAGTYNPQASGSAFNPRYYNQMVAQTAAFGVFGGFGTVMSGLVLSTGSGLNLAVSAGTANIMGQVEYSGGVVTVPDSTALGFVWLLQNGTLTATTSTTPPSANSAYIGNFTTSGGNVTIVDYTSVPYSIGNNVYRWTNDRSAPTDTPNSGTFYHTITAAGHYIFNGVNYYAAAPTTQAYEYIATLTVPFQVIVQDAGLTLNLTASGGDQTVNLPNPSGLPTAWVINLNNVGSSHSLVVKDYTGVTTYATLTQTNNFLSIPTYTNSSGTVIFPPGPYNPGPIPTPGPVPAPVPPSNFQTITTTKALTATDPTYQVLVPSGSNQTVLLPDPTTLTPNTVISIYNPSGTSHSLVIKDHTNTTSYTTLSANQITQVPLYVNSSGVCSIPSGPFPTPGPPTPV